MSGNRGSGVTGVGHQPVMPHNSGSAECTSEVTRQGSPGPDSNEGSGDLCSGANGWFVCDGAPLCDHSHENVHAPVFTSERNTSGVDDNSGSSLTSAQVNGSCTKERRLSAPSRTSGLRTISIVSKTRLYPEQVSYSCMNNNNREQEIVSTTVTSNCDDDNRTMESGHKIYRTIYKCDIHAKHKCDNDLLRGDLTQRFRENSPASDTYEWVQKSSAHVPPPTGASCKALRNAIQNLYRIDDFFTEKIGAGFFSEVFKVTHKSTGAVMVLKMNTSQSNRTNMLREVQLMNKLEHPYILKFKGVCVHEGQLHALTEYINGGNLGELLTDKEQELSWHVRLKLALNIAEGMAYFHSKGLFHRDLTSKNILIRRHSDGNLEAIVGDFGLVAKIPDPLEKSCRLSIVGSPYWMAPECLNATIYNEKADVFSYGIILCEIIARCEADPDVLPRSQNFGLDYVAFSEMVGHCPIDFLQVCFCCVQMDPKKRPSFSLIAQALEDFIFIYETNEMSKHLAGDSTVVKVDCDTSKLDTDNREVTPGAIHRHKRSRSEDSQQLICMLRSCQVDPHGGSTSLSSDSTENMTTITPAEVGKEMSVNDPFYTPATNNPFATSSQFKDVKKLLGTPREYSWAFDICSPSVLKAPPSTPAEDDWFPSHYRHLMSDRPSRSLPPSPVPVRRRIEQFESDPGLPNQSCTCGYRPLPKVATSEDGELDDTSSVDSAVDLRLNSSFGNATATVRRPYARSNTLDPALLNLFTDKDCVPVGQTELNSHDIERDESMKSCSSSESFLSLDDTLSPTSSSYCSSDMDFDQYLNTRLESSEDRKSRYICNTLVEKRNQLRKVDHSKLKDFRTKQDRLHLMSPRLLALKVKDEEKAWEKKATKKSKNVKQI